MSFTVEPADVAAAGGKVCELAEALAAVRGRWAKVADRPGDACGYAESTRRYADAQDAWFEEFGVFIRLLEELCAGMRLAATGYVDSDDAARRRLPDGPS
jgi:hypothetical protein